MPMVPRRLPVPPWLKIGPPVAASPCEKFSGGGAGGWHQAGTLGNITVSTPRKTRAEASSFVFVSDLFYGPITAIPPPLHRSPLIIDPHQRSTPASTQFTPCSTQTLQAQHLEAVTENPFC